MDDATALFAAWLGVLTTSQLQAHGVSVEAIRRGVERGSVQRLRRGWIAFSPDTRALAATLAHGCLTCLTALEHHGVWTPEHTGDHVRVQERRRRGCHGCRPYGSNPPIRRSIDDLETALRCALRCLSPAGIVVVLDSMLHLKLATEHELRRWLESAPQRVRRLIDLTDRRTESGTETMVRLRLRSLQIQTRIQVWLDDCTRVDLLIGDRLVIECDSVEFHASRGAQERDRRRDARLLARGYLVLRVTCRRIHDDWPGIEAEILEIIRREDHRGPVRAA